MTTEVTVTVKKASDGLWELVVERCPLCGRRHVHGGGVGPDPVLGHRQPHCCAAVPCYEVVAEEVEVP